MRRSGECSLAVWMLIVVSMLYGTGLAAQVPQRISYQAVVRDGGGAILPNASVSLRFALRQGSAVGPVVYQETHAALTNSFGLVNREIGGGTVNSGSMAGIDWSQGQLFLQVDVNIGSGFVDMGTTGLVSVPYALHAGSAITATDMEMGDLSNVSPVPPSNGQVLQWNGVAWIPATITSGTVYTAGSGIGIAGNVISNTGDTNAADDITTGSTAGGDLSGTFGNLQLVANAVGSAELSNNAVTQAKLANNAVGGAQIIDGSVQGADLSQMGAASGEVLKWNGTVWAPATDVGGGAGDNWGTQVVQADATLSGQGITGNTLRIAQQGATSGQVLKWNGTTWAPAADASGSAYTAGAGISIVGNVVTNTGDTNAADDITTGSTAGGDLSGTFSNLQLVANAVGATELANNAVTSAKIADGTIAAADLSQMGAANGQVLKWNGTAWVPSADGGGTVSGTTNYLPKFTAPTVLGNSLIVENGAGVGIGDPDPSALLEVAGDVLINGIVLGRVGGNHDWNTVVGNGSFYQNTSGVRNTIMGFQSMYTNSSGTSNSAYGIWALRQNTAGSGNSAFGDNALHWNTTGGGNVAVGREALMFNTTANSNTGVGSLALRNNTTGDVNVAVGMQALRDNTTGASNVAVGTQTMASNTTGMENVAVGYQALTGNATSSFNTAVGSRALSANAGASNTAMGAYALSANGSGSLNTSVGSYALTSNTSGSSNTAVGASALFSNTMGIENTAMGKQAMQVNTGGRFNAAYGTFALGSNTTGDWNTAVGHLALAASTVANSNCGIGAYALSQNVSGGLNAATGREALNANVSGSENTAMGYRALYANVAGDGSVGVGRSAMANMTGSGNTGLGMNAALNLTTGNWNTAVGRNSMSIPAAGQGSWNTAVGYNTGMSNGSLANTTTLGTDATATATDQVRVGNVFVNSIGGQVGWTTLSDGRYKTEVSENVPGLDFISRLRPVTYRIDRDALNTVLGVAERRSTGGDPVRGPAGSPLSGVTTGFIAQEVEQAAREAGFEFSGVDAPANENDHYGLRYAEFVVPLVKAVQEQQEQIRLLREENARIAKLLEALLDKQ